MAEESILKRVAPNAPEAEQSVIGAMLMDRDAIEIAGEYVAGEDFYNRQLGIFFDAMTELNREGRPVDAVTLQDRLKEKNVPPEVSSVEYIRDLVSAVPMSANVKYYAQIVAEKATLRRLIHACEETVNAGYAGGAELDVILNDAEKRIFQVTQRHLNTDYTSIRDIVVEALQRINKASRIKSSVTGLATGFTDLDYYTAGLQPSDLILIAARPSMGKTALALNIAEYMAFRKQQTVAIFSLEMSRGQLMNRLFSMEARVDAQHIRTGNMQESDWERLVESADVIGASKLIIDDTPGITVAEMRSKCRRFKLDHDLKAVFVDYLQLMGGDSKRNTDSRQQEISDISRSLKALARELNVPIVALSQLSRAVEQRPDHRPMLSDLRESGAIEQDADVVMFIYREDYYKKDTERRGIADIIIAKQRNGPVGSVELLWQAEYTKFQNLAKR